MGTIKSNVAFRAKNVFWQGQVYTKDWEPVVSGKYAAEVIPILEETTDKTQDLSIAGRMGLWTAGSVDGWGYAVRAMIQVSTVRDNSRHKSFLIMY